MIHTKHGIIKAKNIAHLKKILKQYDIIVPLTFYPSSYFFSTRQNNILVYINNIREFSTIIKTSSSLIIGLNTTLQRIKDLHAHYPIPSILIDIIQKSCNQDSLESIRLIDIINTHEKYNLMKLAFCLLRLHILVVKSNRQYWMSINDYYTNGIDTAQCIPLSLRFDLNVQTKHSITTRELYPTLPSLAILGIIELDKEVSKILDIRLCIYKNNIPYYLSSEMNHFRQLPYPLKINIQKNIHLIKKITLPYLTHVEQGYFLETLVSLVHPNLL